MNERIRFTSTDTLLSGAGELYLNVDPHAFVCGKKNYQVPLETGIFWEQTCSFIVLVF